jgi:hypothetical protein
MGSQEATKTVQEYHLVLVEIFPSGDFFFSGGY